MNLEKRNYNNTYIKKLIDTEGNEITNPTEIIEEQKIYYKKLYSTRYKSSKAIEIQQEADNFLNNPRKS